MDPPTHTHKVDVAAWMAQSSAMVKSTALKPGFPV